MYTSVCWHTALLEVVSVTEMTQVDEASLAHQHSAQHHGSVQQATSCISPSRLEVT